MTPPTDPLAELQALRAKHDEWHRMVRSPCSPDYYEACRWIMLCDRLAAALEAAEQDRDGWKAMAVVANESNGLLADALERAGIPDPRIALGEAFMAAALAVPPATEEA